MKTQWEGGCTLPQTLPCLEQMAVQLLYKLKGLSHATIPCELLTIWIPLKPDHICCSLNEFTLSSGIYILHNYKHVLISIGIFQLDVSTFKLPSTLEIPGKAKPSKSRPTLFHSKRGVFSVVFIAHSNSALASTLRDLRPGPSRSPKHTDFLVV